MNRSRGLRVLVGLAALVALLVAAFSSMNPWIPTWGSTEEERARAMPGDQVASPPLMISWTHGITIRAVPEAVWPWIVQMGDVRGGFYSYTFIENLVAPQEYRNADRIIPELQNPSPGTGMIGEFLRMREIQANRHLLATLELPEARASWLWALSPLEGDKTRLVVRFRAHFDFRAPRPLLAAAGFIFNYGGFVMERKMMTGIKSRSEGRIEPGWYQGVEIALWLLAFALAVAAAVAYLGRWVWWRALLVGLASAVFLLYLTFGQPPVWVRIPLLLLQAVAVGWAFRSPPMPRRRKARR